MKKVTKKAGVSVDEKRAWAKEWMKANPDKVTVVGVNDAVMKQFGQGFGKQVVTSLVREARGGSPRPAAKGNGRAKPGVGGGAGTSSPLAAAAKTINDAKKLGAVAIILADGTRLDI